ncbi:hypothetical protein [Rhizobium sp. AN69]|uniref:hypothetical protein n=1 Tax=Rhizobium sp. AN69 TaxID=3035213 RepID=UPI002B25B31D|nr:hypothetical protein [Rhizobium sp. AN69]
MFDETTNDTLKMPQALSIRSIAPAHGLLLDRLKDTDTLVVEVPKDADADLSFVQTDGSLAQFRGAEQQDDNIERAG